MKYTLLGMIFFSAQAMNVPSVNPSSDWCFYGSNSTSEPFKTPTVKMPDETKKSSLVNFDTQHPFVYHPHDKKRLYVFYNSALIECEKESEHSRELEIKMNFAIPLNFDAQKLVINDKGALLLAATFAKTTSLSQAVIICLKTQKMVQLNDYDITKNSWWPSLRFGEGATIVAEYNATRKIWDFESHLSYLDDPAHKDLQ